MPKAIRNFSITSASGSMIFLEGQEVPANIAELYPDHIEGTAIDQEPVVHNPNLKEKMTAAEAAALSYKDLVQWIRQFRSGSMPAGKPSKEDLVILVQSLSE
jgi:hypothetical protein